MACLFFSEEDVQRSLDMPSAIDAMQEAFVAISAGQADNVPRTRAKAPGIVLHSMSAAAEYLGLVGWKQYSTCPGGALFHVGLYDQKSGSLLALISADRMGQIRTGAVSGLAIRQLANSDANKVGLLGAGWQAESQLAAAVAARPIQKAFVYSRTPQKRESFARKMSTALKIEVVAVDSAKEAVENLPIVITATTSRKPVLEGSWLAPGAVLCVMGSNWLNKTEIDVEAVRRSQAVVCDSIAACKNEAGDFVEAIQQGEFNYENAVELADVVAGQRSPRSSEEDILIFKSVGMAIEDVALGGLLLDRAKAKGIGQELPF